MKQMLRSIAVALALGSGVGTALNVDHGSTQLARRSVNVRGAAAVAQAPEVSATIPPAADVGPNGYPELPAVNVLLNLADSTAQSLSSQTSTLEKRMAEVQKERASRMEKQKALFEKKLQDQEQTNQILLQENNKVSLQIETLKSGNAAIIKHAHELQDSNSMMRAELKALGGRLRNAVDFVSDSMEKTDDSEATELVVLDPKVQQRMLGKRGSAKVEDAVEEEAYPTLSNSHSELAEVQKTERIATASKAAPSAAAKTGKAAPQEDEQEEEDEDEEDVDADSFIAIAKTTQTLKEPVLENSPVLDATQKVAEDPHNLLTALEQGVQELEAQQKASEAKLKEVFVKDYQNGANRHAALLEQQQALNGTRDALTNLQNKLRSAEQRLNGTKTSLSTRLQSLGLFLQKMAHLGVAPASEVPHLLQSLPTYVAGGEPKVQDKTPVVEAVDVNVAGQSGQVSNTLLDAAAAASAV